MKSFHITLLSLAALALAGCSPTHPPSSYGTGPSTSNATGNQGLFGGGNLAPDEGDLERRSGSTGNVTSLFDPQTGEYDSRAIFTTIYFGFDKYGVDTSERSKLSGILGQAQNVRLIVAGYTDHFGTDQYNHGLSDKRAQSVKNYLVGLGISESNIEIQAFGKQYARPTGSRDEVAQDRKAVVVNADFKP